MTHRRRLLLSGLAVITAALLGPKIVPLYDGVGFPDEPYRYVGRAGQTNPPTPVSQTVPAGSLAQFNTTLQSPESGPQAQVTFGPGAISLPPGTSELTITATPQAPSGQPTSGSIESNGYLISANPVQPKVKSDSARIFLRLPQGISFKSAPTIVFRSSSSGQWRPLQTAQTGTDIYTAHFAGWGEYAVAINMTVPLTPNAQKPKPPVHNTAVLVFIALIIGFIATLIAIIRHYSALNHAARKSK